MELNMLSGDIPDGKDPRPAGDWWESLSPEQRKQVELSDPVGPADLPGVPDSVKGDLRATGRPAATTC